MTFGMNDELYLRYLTFREQLAVKSVVILITDIKNEPEGAMNNLPIKTDLQEIDDDLYAVFEHINQKANQRYIEININNPANVYSNIKMWCDRHKESTMRSSAFERIKAWHIWDKLDGKTDFEKLVSALKYECDVQLETLDINPKNKRHLTLALKYIDNTARSIIASEESNGK